MAIFLKDPEATLDYAVDWSAGYFDGQTISTSAWAVAPLADDGVVVASQLIDGGRTVALLAGGRPGETYRITNSVTLSDGRSDERILLLRVEDR